MDGAVRRWCAAPSVFMTARTGRATRRDVPSFPPVVYGCPSDIHPETRLASRYGLEIRAATAADAAGLASLFQASGQSIAASDLAERLDSLRLGSGTALIAVEWGPPSGLVVLHWYRSLTAAQPVAQITGLMVGPDERRRGIGRLLLKAASQAARSAGMRDPRTHCLARRGEPAGILCQDGVRAGRVAVHPTAA